jgi:uncharacterized membrane protein
MVMKRALKHLLIPGWLARWPFTPAVLDRIEAAIRASELSHDAELRFVIEGAFDVHHILRGVTARKRAVELFSQLRVWDTKHNSGVLIYVQCVDRHIEIVADRGVAAKLAQHEWDAICRRMEDAFRAGRHEAGALQGTRDITALLAAHFPASASNPDELPDRPVVL